MTEQKVYRVDHVSYRELGPLTKDDVLQNPDIIVGHHDGEKMAIGNCYMATETSVMFNPYADWAWYDVPLSEMVKLQSFQEEEHRGE